ncbi:hypothetical protein [Shewanella colwelliana]|uniref:hypothetical protein n=1 Tax=Shewanella colwelliana TaxID=23 RepID=UPI0022B05244|nr:hypothetical protein [Shewanella colwelliana]MCZ4337303.1 hypothetical protein [Shewanella colwelliana]
MERQQQADSELMQVYGKIIAIVLMLLILAILGFKFFASVEKVSANGLKVEHSRLLNVLAMVRSQWLTQGRPPQMRLDWSTSLLSDNDHQGVISMSQEGWPIIAGADIVGCKELWWQLLGSRVEAAQISTEISRERNVCSYIAKNGDRLSYQLTSGRVIFLTKE